MLHGLPNSCSGRTKHILHKYSVDGDSYNSQVVLRRGATRGHLGQMPPPKFFQVFFKTYLNDCTRPMRQCVTRWSFVLTVLSMFFCWNSTGWLYTDSPLRGLLHCYIYYYKNATLDHHTSRHWHFTPYHPSIQPKTNQPPNILCLLRLLRFIALPL